MPQSDILLVTLNATYQHTAFGLRYLLANLGELRTRASLKEFTIAHKPRDIVETLLAQRPRLVGFGVYIWNTKETEAVIGLLKQVAPDICVVIGGPEVSYEAEGQTLSELADVVIQGEADHAFADFCRAYFSHGKYDGPKLRKSELPKIQEVALPYSLYSDEDIRHRILYVEASRGCPYKCEFCLSSLDTSVRNFDLAGFLLEMDALIARGARQFKFVDRTFNLSPAISSAILDFFLERVNLGLFLHFELVPDRLPDALKERIARFPEGSLQFEIGVQTWDTQVARLISRRQDYEKVVGNFRYLAQHTKVHTHADLIVGLPGETLETFARGFDRLAELSPSEIQVGLLKRLKGTPIIRHDAEWAMRYQAEPPFTVTQTKTMNFATIVRLERFSKFWDLYANSGHFPNTMRYFRELATAKGSLFALFWEFSEFLNQRHPQRHSIALVNLVESVWLFLIEVLGCSVVTVRELLVQDYCGYVKRDVPAFLRDDAEAVAMPKAKRSATPSRQSRFLGIQH